MVLFARKMVTRSTPPASSSPSLSAFLRRFSEVAVVRFGVVGVSNAVISYGAFWSAHRVLRASTAQGIAYTLGTLWSYYWNRRWTFQSQAKVASEAGRFFILQFGFLLLSSLLLGLLVDREHLPPGPCWLAVSALVTALNFVASRFWAFKPRVDCG
jgi:putative flippase GtrA